MTPDPTALALAGLVVVVVVPAEAAALHIGLALLRQQEHRAQIVCQRGETGLVVEARSAHQAAMQRHDQRRRSAQAVRAVEKGVKRAGVVTEIGERLERDRPRRTRIPTRPAPSGWSPWTVHPPPRRGFSRRIMQHS